ncbi:Amidophosphoribosyltransferase [Erythrobacter dokdonensis DSW-74]|uniref:Amidophosphoribosyltransferase n=1 Tax=Erythrobacter dokdonensis DSW-74 TaxID=1300349 RepID=A0A1A7BJJ2_9SPHN|nr:Amidophosphoribosyltransferase [Erythrobacter dokdonensis DSW-74]
MKPLVDLVYPPRCPLCGTALADQDGLCADCWSLLDIPGEGGGEAVAAWHDHGRPVPAHAATFYNDASRRLVLDYKHGRRIALARLLARLIAARLPETDAGLGKPVLVPVPLHRWRLWQRGFNQAALLAVELARLGKGEVLVDGLLRRKRTPSLGGLGREARDRALAGAIIVNPRRRAAIAGRDVVLVDDVFTSGATARACVGALAGADARSVSVACFARVDDGGHRGASPKNETPEAL